MREILSDIKDIVIESLVNIGFILGEILLIVACGVIGGAIGGFIGLWIFR